jgi:hypothetical protein
VTEPRTPAEERLAALFLLLRADAPRPSDDLRTAIMRSLRRQHLVRSALAVIEELLTAIGRALAVLFGVHPSPVGS